MKIVFRADASSVIGAGHVTRCLALAEELASRDMTVFFLCREISDSLCNMVQSRGIDVGRLPCHDGAFDPIADAKATRDWLKRAGDVDWVVADRHQCDSAWDRTVREASGAICVIDDLARDERECDLLLNQNYLPGVEDEYAQLLPSSARLLTGPRYALLRSTFRRMRQRVQPHSGYVNRILVSFGGSDTREITRVTLEGLRLFAEGGGAIDVVTGPSFTGEQAHALAEIAPNLTIHQVVDDMAAVMVAVDLVIGSLGVSSWERMCLGVPSVVITIAQIQERIAQAVARDNYFFYLGRAEEITAGCVEQTLVHLKSNASQLREQASRGQELVDGCGSERVTEALCNN